MNIMNRPAFVTKEIYHLYNRGVEKRKVFECDKDYLRYIHDLYEFNDTRPAQKSSEVGLPKITGRMLRGG